MESPQTSEQEKQSHNESSDSELSNLTSRVENLEFVDALENSPSTCITNNPENLNQDDTEESETHPSAGGDIRDEKLADRLNRELQTNVNDCDVKHEDFSSANPMKGDCSGMDHENKKRTECENDLLAREDNSCSEDGSDEEEAYHSAEEGDNIVTDETYLKEIEDTLTEEEKNDRRKEAQGLKEEGNSLFKAGEYREAVKAYRKALQLCPLSFAKDRSIMYSNRAACFMRMDDAEQAIADSSRAVELNPQYLKAVLRRAELYEKGDKLDEALADYKRVVELDPGHHVARAACMRLPDQIKERNEKMKEEMIGKLKDLGNMILKPFGLSTNNFQLQQDPNTGGYSVKFNNNGK